MPDELPDELTPAEQQVRRLLAEARHTDPLPDDVAARLDAVLADLPTLSPAGDVAPDPGPERRPVDLAAARRRRTARSLLVAAAAVVVLGVGLHQLTDSDLGGSAGDDSSSDAGGAAQESAPAPADADAGGDQADKRAEGTQERVPLTSEQFTAEVRRIQPAGLSSTRAEQAELDALSGSRTARAGCPTIGWGPGRLVPVSYDGDAGALIYRPPTGDTQIVDLFLCGERDPTRSITLTAP